MSDGWVCFMQGDEQAPALGIHTHIREEVGAW